MKFQEKMSTLMSLDMCDIHQTQEVLELFECVESFSLEMKARLLQKYVETGWTGWKDRSDAKLIMDLPRRMKGNVDSGEPIDVANLAMFFWYLLHKKDKIDMKVLLGEEE